MVGPSVSAWLMIVLCRFESGRYRSFRNAPHPLSDVLCGLTYALGRKAFLLSAPGRFVDDFTDGVLSGVETLRCGFFFSCRRRHTRCSRDWSSDVCSSD